MMISDALGGTETARSLKLSDLVMLKSRDSHHSYKAGRFKGFKCIHALQWNGGRGIFTSKNQSSTTIISYGIWIDLVTILSRIGRGVKTSPKNSAFLEVSAQRRSNSVFVAATTTLICPGLPDTGWTRASPRAGGSSSSSPGWAPPSSRSRPWPAGRLGCTGAGWTTTTTRHSYGGHTLMS